LAYLHEVGLGGDKLTPEEMIAFIKARNERFKEEQRKAAELAKTPVPDSPKFINPEDN
jgi:hypothetical protein